ncbi:hypothetical protein [Streptomyces sp. NPDC056190]|uniref:hypothetical protein n=1 Tax=Streptomyces sp. NPDC056190 TaxID=3345741 RepID=UPI0035D88E97
MGVGRDFTAAEPGTKLVSGITYLPTLAGWWYLATVIDRIIHVAGGVPGKVCRAALVARGDQLDARRGQQVARERDRQRRCGVMEPALLFQSARINGGRLQRPGIGAWLPWEGSGC